MSFLALLDLEICISLGSFLLNVSAKKKKAFVVSLFGRGATFSCLRQDVFSFHNTVLKYTSWQQRTKINPTT